MDTAKIVKDTWKEIGGEIETRGWWIWVRTVPFEKKIGSIWMPPKLQGFYGKLPHLVTLQGIVLQAGPAGPAGEMKAGDMVAFKRLHFAHYRNVGLPESQEHVGWVNSNDVMFFCEPDAEGNYVHVQQTFDGLAAAAPAPS